MAKKAIRKRRWRKTRIPKGLNQIQLRRRIASEVYKYRRAVERCDQLEAERDAAVATWKLASASRDEAVEQLRIFRQCQAALIAISDVDNGTQMPVCLEALKKIKKG